MSEVGKIQAQQLSGNATVTNGNVIYAKVDKQPESVFVTEKATSKEVDGDIQRIGSENLKKAAKHLSTKARENTAKQARNGFLKAGFWGTIGGLAGIGAVVGIAAVLSAPVSIPLVLLGAGAGLLGAAGGAATSVAHTVKKIDENLYDEFAANNLLNDSEHTKSQDNKTYVNSNNFFINLAIKNADYHGARVSDEKLQEAIKESGVDSLTRLVYIQKPAEGKSAPAVVHYAEIDAKEYRNIGDHARNFKGRRDMPPIYLNRAYYDTHDEDVFNGGLLSEFSKKGKMSDAETKRFIEIAKALSTDDKYSVDKNDTVDPDANAKEDADFFDFNNDNKIDYNDLVVLNTLLKAKRDNASLDRTTDGMRFATADLNGDGILDSNDLAIYDYAKAKADINADGDFNKQDKDILIKYLVSRIKFAKGSCEQNDILMESLGFTGYDKNIAKKKKIFLLDMEKKILELN